MTFLDNEFQKSFEEGFKRSELVRVPYRHYRFSNDPFFFEDPPKDDQKVNELFVNRSIMVKKIAKIPRRSTGRDKKRTPAKALKK